MQVLLYVALSSIGFASFLIGVSNINGGLFSLKSGGLILVGITLLTVFSVLQLKAEKPMLNLRVFKYPSFRIAVILSLCMYLIAMGNAMVLPIFTKSLCGFSDTSYGFATIFGSVLAVFALQSVAMSTLNSPTTAMALSGLEGRERVDGSAIFNTLRQISSSLASNYILEFVC